MMRLLGLGVTTAHNDGTGAVLGISACPVRSSEHGHSVNDRSDFRALLLIAQSHCCLIISTLDCVELSFTLS